MIYWLLMTVALSVAHSQHVDQYCNTFEIEHKIVDIKASVRQGAILLDGTYKETLSDCVLTCCDMEECDLAVYRIKGTSSSNRNCYLIHCGDFDNCVLVSHVNFTAISLSNINAEAPTSPTPTMVVNPTLISSDEDNVTESTTIVSTTTTTISIPLTTVPTTSSTSAYRSPVPTPSSSTYTTTTSHISSSTGSSSSSTTSSSTTSTTLSSSTVMPVPTLSVNPDVSKPPNLGGPGGPSKKPADEDHRLCGNASCSKSKVAGLVVACTLVAVLLAIVILVVVKKSWDRHRHTKYKKIDYLIDGMYS